MKILFYQRGNVKDPIGLFSLFAVLHGKHDVSYCRTEAELKDALSLRPDFLMFSVYTGDSEYFKKLAEEVKKQYPKIKIVAGGPHPTFYPKYIDECEAFDAICLGEGEGPAVKFLELYGKETAYLKTPNFYIRAGGEIIRNQLEPRIADLDALPMPDRSLIYKRYPDEAKAPLKYFLFGRGCPFDCTYCFNHKIHEMYSGVEASSHRVRQRSPELAIEEMLRVKAQYGLEVVRIIDDVLTFKKTWLREFIPLYRKKVGLPFICHYRMNLVDQEVVELLKEGNCITVSVAIESGDSHLRNNILKRNMSDETIYNAIRLLKKGGLKVVCENITGLPGETSEQALKTLEMNIKTGVDHGYCSLLQPYPGLQITEYAIRGKYFDGNFKRLPNNYSQYSTLDFKDTATKEFLENLASVFPFCVDFPRARPILLFLAKHLPHSLLMTKLFVTVNALYYEQKVKGLIFSTRHTGKPLLVTLTILRIFSLPFRFIAKKCGLKELFRRYF